MNGYIVNYENMGGHYLKLNDIGAYKIAFRLSNYVWDEVVQWSHFQKETVGKQFVRAVDSIAANLAEGFGRYNKKDRIKFYRYALGSQKESLNWNEVSKARGLFTQEKYNFIYKELQLLPREIYFLIRYTEEKLTM